MSLYSSHSCFHLSCILFCIWVQPQVPFSFTLVHCQTCLNSCMLCFEDVVLKGQPVLTGFVFNLCCGLLGHSAKLIPGQGEICSPDLPCCNYVLGCALYAVVFVFSPSLRTLNSMISWLLQPRLLLAFTSPSSSSLFVSNRSSRAYSLVWSLMTCTKK